MNFVIRCHLVWRLGLLESLGHDRHRVLLLLIVPPGLHRLWSHHFLLCYKKLVATPWLKVASASFIYESGCILTHFVVAIFLSFKVLCSRVSNIYVRCLLEHLIAIAIIYSFDYLVQAWCFNILVVVEVFIQNFDWASWSLSVTEDSHKLFLHLYLLSLSLQLLIL